MKMNIFKVGFIALVGTSLFSCKKPQKDYTPADAHSHNDYKNSIPFYRAYNAGFGSIEADVFAVNGQLMVAHEEKEITPEHTLKAMYIDPLVVKLKQDTRRRLRLLIEIKKDYSVTLPLVEKELQQLSQYIWHPGHPNRLSIVMTGAVPPGNIMLQYPDWILFDVDHLQGFTPQELTKIGLVSVPFSRYSKWKGVGDLPQADVDGLKRIIDSAHAVNKKIRFWDTPDNPTAWKKLIDLGSDVIGTDHINELADYLNKKEYK